jgi:toxin ParE1/3/4
VGQTRSVRLRYTLPALADLSAILDHIAVHSPQGARRIEARIQALTDLLLQHPHIGRRTSDPAIRRMTDDASPLFRFLRDHADRDHHPRRPSRSPRSVRNARLCLSGS